MKPLIRAVSNFALLTGLMITPIQGAPVQTLIPVQLPDTEEIVNPLRGGYSFYSIIIAAQPDPPLESYLRVSWKQLEPTAGHYDFSVIDKELAKLPAGASFAFRIMALNGYETNSDGMSVPANIATQCPKGFFVPITKKYTTGPSQIYIPDWNCGYFLEQVNKLLYAVGAKYGRDKRVSWVDIGIFGNYGEWHMYSLTADGTPPYPDVTLNVRNALPATLATRQRIVDFHIAAFPNKRLLMLTDDTEMLLYALRYATTIPIGMRRDSFGSNHFDQDFVPVATSAKDAAMIRDRWKVAPLSVEYAGTNSLQVGAAGLISQIERWHVTSIADNILNWSATSDADKAAYAAAMRRSGYRYAVQKVTLTPSTSGDGSSSLTVSWLNTGVTPTYEKWTVTYTLCGTSGTCQTPITSGFGLGSLMPTGTTTGVNDTVNIPATVPPGDYDLKVSITDPGNFRLPLKLSNTSRNSDGSYTLGKLQF